MRYQLTNLQFHKIGSISKEVKEKPMLIGQYDEISCRENIEWATK